MNSQEKLDLKNLMGKITDDYVDNTSGIREMKHSSLIRADINKMENFKKEKAELRFSNPLEFQGLCECECYFLFSRYTDIYNRLLKDEIDLTIMEKALDVLFQIEEGKIDQEEGSVIVGKLFHEIYVDSALKRSEKLDKLVSSDNIPKYEGKSITWKDYKNR
jgi:hypothetical protein